MFSQFAMNAKQQTKIQTQQMQPINNICPSNTSKIITLTHQKFNTSHMTA